MPEPSTISLARMHLCGLWSPVSHCEDTKAYSQRWKDSDGTKPSQQCQRQGRNEHRQEPVSCSHKCFPQIASSQQMREDPPPHIHSMLSLFRFPGRLWQRQAVFWVSYLCLFHSSVSCHCSSGSPHSHFVLLLQPLLAFPKCQSQNYPSKEYKSLLE